MPRHKVPEEERSSRQQFTGARVRRVRIEMGLTQLKFGELLGLRGDRGVSDIERGINAIDIYRLQDLARRSGYAMEFFVNTAYKPALRLKPTTLDDWEALYPGEPERARIHWDTDRHLDRSSETTTP